MPNGIHPLVAYLEERRKEEGITQASLSIAAGYDEEYWWNVVAGRWAPNLHAFCDHAEMLGYSFRLMKDR